MIPAEITLADGTVVRLRPITPADVALLIDIFAHMGAESRYLRFHEATREPDVMRVLAEAQAIAEMPLAAGQGWLALARTPDGALVPLGAVRYVLASDGESAEFALSVRDDYQRRGLGTWFMEYMLDQARTAGLARLFGYVQHENEGMWRLLQRLSVEVETRFEEGEPVVTLFVQRQREPLSPTPRP